MASAAASAAAANPRRLRFACVAASPAAAIAGGEDGAVGRPDGVVASGTEGFRLGADGRRDATQRLRTARADFSDLVVICRKCAKRQGVGKAEFRASLKRAFKGSGRKAKLVESGCLGPCPKRLLTVATPDSLTARRLLLLDPSLPQTALRALLTDRSPRTATSAQAG